MNKWLPYVDVLSEKLHTVEFTEADKNILPFEKGFALWEEQCVRVRSRSRTIFFIGNGASSTMSSHSAADIGKNARFRALVLTDAALMTALGNDISFEQVFAEPLGRFAQLGDMLVAISSSGNSPNIVEAIHAARKAGVWVVTLSGMQPDNHIRAMGNLNCWVNSDKYGMVETSHAAILHYWTDQLVAKYGAAT